MSNKRSKRQLMKMHSQRTQAQRKAATVSHLLEALEPRVMLTTLVGGDTFHYQDPNGQIVQIAIRGDAVVEAIGAEVTGDNEVLLGDLPGAFVSSSIGREGTEVLGGIGGGWPITVVGPTNITAPGGAANPDENGTANAGTDVVAIQAVAAQPDGDTYGFNVLTYTDDDNATHKLVQLLKFNTATGAATVIADLQDELPVVTDPLSADVGKSTVTAIQAADFDPINGRLYFVASATTTFSLTETSGGTDRLYYLDVDAGSAANVLASVTRVSGSFGETAVNPIEVRSITFDQTGLGSQILRGYAIRDVAGVPTGQLFRMSFTGAENTNAVSYYASVTLNGAAVSTVSGISLVDEDPTLADEFLYAVTADGASSKLLRVRESSGTSTVMSLLRDPDPDAATLTGQDLRSLTWNPIIVNPATGQPGVLMSTDATTDQLVLIDPTARKPYSDLFALYISQASTDVTISIAVVNTTPDGVGILTADGILHVDGTPDTIIPGSHTEMDLQVIPTDGGAPIIVTFQDGTGGAYIGARLWVDRGNGPEPLAPVIEGLLDGPLGVRPANLDDASDGSPDNTFAGISAARSLLEYYNTSSNFAQRLLTQNFDNVRGFSVSREGVMVAVDTDGLDDNGNAITNDGNEIAVISSANGRALAPVVITNSAGGAELAGLQGLDFGDTDFDGAEELFAVMITGNPNAPVLGRLDYNTGVFTEIGALTDGGTTIAHVGAMAFSPGEGSIAGQQGLYVVDADTNRLYEINPLTGAILGTGDEVVDANGDPLVISNMEFDRNGTLLGQVVTDANLVDIDLSTRGSGSLVAGVLVSTEIGSLRPTVGAISYDYTNDRFLAVDNAASLALIENEGSAAESAALMILSGTAGDSALPQNLDSILVAGKVTGKVNLPGSIDTFYAGVLLTGNAAGQGQNAPDVPLNFVVGGDIRNLITMSSIGASNDDGLDEPTYLTGFDMSVGGKVGQIWANDSILGNVGVINSSLAPKLPATALAPGEIEIRPIDTDAEGVNFEQGRLLVVGNDPADLPENIDQLFWNDTLDTAQILGPVSTGVANEPDVVRVSGEVDFGVDDLVDFYAVPLLAGQTVTVQVVSTNNLVPVGVFNPDGLLIASDFDAVDHTATVGRAFQITADRPGLYRFGVGTFTEAVPLSSSETQEGDGGFSVVPFFAANYDLVITGAGDLAVGAIKATNNIYSPDPGTAIIVNRGDLGALLAGDTILFEAFAALTTNVLVSNGNLVMLSARDVSAWIDVPRGSVGLIHGTDSINTGTPDGPIGGNLQVIDSQGDVQLGIPRNFPNLGDPLLSLQLTGGIGTIRADNARVFLQLNTDSLGDDGTIDLIHTTGDFGGRIDTGLGGNVGYLLVEGDIINDGDFGQGQEIRHFAGESVVINDDGGGVVSLSPAMLGNEEPDPETDELTNPYVLTTRTFATANGGLVLASVKSTGGIVVSANSSQNGRPIAIGKIEVEGDGRGVEVVSSNPLAPGFNDTNLRLIPDPTGTDAQALPDLNVIIQGAPNSPVDVLEIDGGDFTNIANYTAGEIVTVIANSIGNLYASTLGLAHSSTGAAVYPSTVLSNNFPFYNQHTGIRVASDAAAVSATQGLGNLIIGGNLGTVRPNYDGIDAPGVDEGINAPIYANGFISSVNIGEGLYADGGGAAPRSGIYAGGIIVSVTGHNADIRGHIASQEEIRSISLTNGSIINSRILVGPFLDETHKYDWVATVTDVTRIQEIIETINGVSTTTTNTVYVTEIGSVTLSGNGGIIGSFFTGADIGPVTVRGGFGVLSSRMLSGPGSQPNNIGNFTVDGYGIQDVDFGTVFLTDLDDAGTPEISGVNQANITATGAGGMLPATNYETSVRRSETDTFDPSTGYQPNALTDIQRFLGGPRAELTPMNVEVGDVFTITNTAAGLTASVSYTAAAATADDVITGLMTAWNAANHPLLRDITASVDLVNGMLILRGDTDIVPFVLTTRATNGGRTGTQKLFLQSNRDSGVLADVDARGGRNLGTVSGFRIEDSVFKFGNAITGFRTLSTMDNLTVVTGSLGTFTPGADVSGLFLEVAGVTGALNFRGSLLDDSQVIIKGPNAYLSSFYVAGNMDGSLVVRGHVGAVTILGDLTGSIDILSPSATVTALQSFTLKGSLSDGSFRVRGNVGAVNIASSLGEDNDLFTIDGNLASLRVGTDTLSNGAVLALDILIVGNLGAFDLAGRMDGDMRVLGDVGSFTIRADAETLAGPILNGDVEVSGAVRSVLLTGGDMGAAAQFVAGQTIGSFNITNGTMREGASVASSFGDVTSFNARANTADDRPTALAGSLGGDFNIVALTATTGGVLYAVNNNAGVLELYRIDRDGLGAVTGFVRLGNLTNSTGGLITQILTLEANPITGLLYLIGLDASAANPTTRRLFTLDPTVAAVDADADTVADEIVVSALAMLANGGAVTLPVTGLAYNRAESKLYGLLRDDKGNADPTDDEDQLISINPTTGAVVHLGTVMVGGELTSISAIEFNSAYQLTALDSTVDGQRLLTINRAAPSRTTISAAAGFSGSLKGLTADSSGVFYSIDGGASPDELVSSTPRFGGSVAAGNGRLGYVTLTGMDAWNADFSAESSGAMNFGWSLLGTSRIEIEQALTSLTVGRDTGASAVVNAGAAPMVNVRRDMMGALNLGNPGGSSYVIVGRNFDASLSVDGNAMVMIAGAGQGSIAVDHDLTYFRVAGDYAGDVVVGGKAGAMSFGSLTDSVVATGFDLASFSVTGAMSNSLLQVGAGAGSDGVFGGSGVFGATTDDKDFGEVSRLSRLGYFRAGTVTESVIASAGDFGGYYSGAMTDSTASSGWSVGSAAIRAVMDDASPLADAGELNAARGGVDRVLLRGDFTNASVTGLVGMVGSAFSAGVDPGNDGIFDDGITPGVVVDRTNVSSSTTGGMSRLGSVSGLTDASSVIAADVLGYDRTTGTGSTFGNITYAISDLTTNHPLEAAFNDPVTLSSVAATGQDWFNLGVRIHVTGPGTVSVFDAVNGDSVLDTLLLQGTTAATTVTITGANGSGITFGRVLTSDDATVAAFNADGDLTGDGTADPDLWIDGAVSRLTLRDLGDNVTGQIGGGVSMLTLNNQGAGKLNIGGLLSSYTVQSGTGNGLFTTLAPTPTSNVTLLSTDAAGNSWVFDATTRQISQVNTGTGAVVTGPFPVTDPLGAALTLTAMDFSAGGTLYAAATRNNPAPTELLGSMTTGTPGLRGLAVDHQNRIAAIDSSTGEDRLVQLDPQTGALRVIGTIKSVFNATYTGMIVQLAFGASGELYGITSDQNGNTAANLGAAILRLRVTDANNDGILEADASGFVPATAPSSVALPAKLLNGGGVTDPFTALAVRANGTIYAVRQAAGQSDLLTINPTTGAITVLGSVQVAGVATDVRGMGFDSDGNLNFLDANGGAPRLVGLRSADLATPTLAKALTLAGAIDVTIDSLAMGKSGDFTTYAYDTDAVGGKLFASTGVAATLGTVDTTTGVFTQLAGIASDLDGTSAAGDAVGLAVNGAGVVHVVTADHLLSRYSAIGTLLSAGAELTDAAGGQVVNGGAMDFDASGVLNGIDRTARRLISIDPATGNAAGRTEPGSVPGDLPAISFNPITGAFEGVVNGSTDAFAQLRGTTSDALGGITASTMNSVRITAGTGFSSRLATTGNSFGSVTIKGDFTGNLSTPGTFAGFMQTDGDFSGAIYAGGMFRTMSILGGDFAADGMLHTDAAATSLGVRGKLGVGGHFAGRVDAWSIGSLAATGDGAATASIATSDLAGALSFHSYDGDMALGSLRTLTSTDALGGNSNIAVAGDVGTINAGGADAGGVINVNGTAAAITFRNVYSGTAAIRMGLGSATFYDTDRGLLDVGLNTRSITARNVSESVFSFGTTIGADGLYNTEDDRVTGGSLASATITGNYIDSVVAVGVLPGMTGDGGLPGDHHAFTGMTDAELTASLTTLNTQVTTALTAQINAALGNPTQSVFNSLFDRLYPQTFAEAQNALVQAADAAEAGGHLRSRLGRLYIRGVVLNSSPTRFSAVVAADGITSITTARGIAAPRSRTYGDPAGAPTITRIFASDDNVIDVEFSEEMNTSSFVLSKDIDGDGLTNGLADTAGSVLVKDSGGNVYNDVRFTYLTVSDAAGTHGVLRLTRDEGFGAGAQVEVFGNLAGAAAVDRSGVRSALRDFNQDGITHVGNNTFADPGEDPFGTILDGDANGVEGGPRSAIVVVSDAPDTFAGAIGAAAASLVVDGGATGLSNVIDRAGDVDLFRFTGTAFQFASFKFVGNPLVAAALFYQDDQGTVDPADDTFEALGRYEINQDLGLGFGNDLFLAYELPATGSYFLAVTSYFYDPTGINTYEVLTTLASTDDMLDGATDGTASLPADEQIGYVSNAIGQNNNLLGANNPRQLIFLDFAGGVSGSVRPGDTIDPFDVSDFNETLGALAGSNAQMIVGGGGVTSIIDNLVSIYANILTTGGARSFDATDLANIHSLSDLPLGITFTTVDPSSVAGFGLGSSEFKTVLIGHKDDELGLFGQASFIDIDHANMGGEAVIFTDTFAFLSVGTGVTNQLNKYSLGFANVIAHELGHTLGFNHTEGFLVADDPDNNPLTDNDPVVDYTKPVGDPARILGIHSAMSAGPNIPVADITAAPFVFGTSTLEPSEFVVGWLDEAWLLQLWLS